MHIDLYFRMFNKISLHFMNNSDEDHHPKNFNFVENSLYLNPENDRFKIIGPLWNNIYWN